MRDAENIRAVADLGVDMMGFIFWSKSPRFVQMISSRAGIIPDYSEERLYNAVDKKREQESYPKPQLPQRVGVFVDEMPQTIVTRVFNYQLDYVQLHGAESRVMIENLKRTLVPDIAPGIKIIKALGIRTKEDVAKYKAYEGVVDMFLFDTKTPEMGGSGQQFGWSLLDAYDGRTPFLLSGGVGLDDVGCIKSFSHPQFAGVDLNSQFEIAPGVKDVEKLCRFISALRS